MSTDLLHIVCPHCHTTNRVKRADQSLDPNARATLLNTDPSYGIGTTEYMRSVGGVAICASLLTLNVGLGW